MGETHQCIYHECCDRREREKETSDITYVGKWLPVVEKIITNEPTQTDLHFNKLG